MAEKPKFIPLPELESSQVRFDLVLPPFVNQNLLGINIMGVEGLLRVGGIGHLTVKSESGDSSSFVPTIVGVDSQGGALADKIGLQTKVSAYEIKNEDPSSLIPFNSRWVDSTIVINIDEMSQRILHESRGWKRDVGIRSPEVWADYLDKTLRHGINSAGNNYLIGGMDRADWFFAVLTGAFAVLLAAPSLVNMDLTGLFGYTAAWEVLSQGIWDVVERQFRREHDLNSGYRWSLFMTLAPHFDRALILNILSRTTTLVSSLPEK